MVTSVTPEVTVRRKHELLLGIVATRSIAVSEAINAKVMACTDTGVLKKWALRAVTAKDLDEIFRD